MFNILSNARKEQILVKLQAQQRASLEELVTLTGASESTVRRDLNELEEQGLIRRLHGGAEIPQSLSSELSVLEKSFKNVQEKEIIAKKAMKYVSDGDVIFVDAGTTTAALILELKRSNKHLTVVTNSPMHGVSLMADNLTVYILGGLIKRSTDSVIGSQATEQLSHYRFNIAFVGANAYDDSIGAMTPDSEEAAIKQQAIKQSDKSYILIDKSKLGKTSFVKFALPEEVEVITE